jgi:hypothetical protein
LTTSRVTRKFQGFEVDVFPLQSENLTDPKAGGCSEQNGGLGKLNKLLQELLYLLC